MGIPILLALGADAPSIFDAPGWIKAMPSAHNGYLDTQLDMGYVGLAFLNLHLRNPPRYWARGGPRPGSGVAYALTRSLYYPH